MTLPAYIPDYVSAPLELAVSPTDVLYGSHIRGTKLVHSLPLEPGTSGTGDAFCSDVLLLYCAFLNLECLILFFYSVCVINYLANSQISELIFLMHIYLKYKINLMSIECVKYFRL